VIEGLVLDPFEVDGLKEPVLPARVEYVPRRWAVPFHQSLKRWTALVLHRRAGKTTSVLLHHQRAAVDDAWESFRLKTLQPELSAGQVKELLRNRLYGHIMPTRVQAKTVGWAILKWMAQAHKGHVDIYENELRIVYHGANDCTVQLFGSDNIDAFRGVAFSGVSLDEYGQLPPNLFSEVLSKALADHLGYCIFAGTIRGKNHLWKTYEAAKDSPEWTAIWQDVGRSLVTENDAATLMLRQAMHDDRKLIEQGLMSQEEFDQEWFLSAEAAIKGAYYAKQIAEARRDRRIGHVPYDPALKVHDVWDLGKGPNMAIGCFQTVGREVHMIHYLEGSESDGIPQMIARLQKLPYVWGKHIGRHDIRAVDLGTGVTRMKTAEALGWRFDVAPDVGVVDGINAGRLLWSRIWIDERNCELFLNIIGDYRRPWNEKLGIFGDNPVHNNASHPADMWRYAAVSESMMTNDKPRPPQSSGPPPVGGRNAWMGV
jgi:hypothetical protein